MERRGSEPSIDGTIQKVDDAGVTIRSDLGAERFIAWDRIRSVNSSVSERQREADARLQMAQDLWRARSRIERGDTTLAEPLMERLSQRFGGQTNETALVVSEGLLRCRLARGEHALAIVPALETARLRRAGTTTASYSMLTAALDDATSLCITLAPDWAPSPLLTRLQHDLETYDARNDEVVAALAWLYGRAAGDSVPDNARTDASQPRQLPRHPGVDLLAAMVDCRVGAPAARHAAAERLTHQLPSLPAWAEPWARYHIGLAMLDDDSLERRQLGLVWLLNVPARFARSQPYLAGLALAQAASALQRDGEADAAAALLAELQRAYSDHPVLTASASKSPVSVPSAPAPRGDGAALHKEQP